MKQQTGSKLGKEHIKAVYCTIILKRHLNKEDIVWQVST